MAAESEDVIGLKGGPLAPEAPDPHDPGVEERISRLEADVREIDRSLRRIAPAIDRMDGFLQATLPTLATKADIAKLATTGQMWTMVASVVAIALTTVAIVVGGIIGGLAT